MDNENYNLKIKAYILVFKEIEIMLEVSDMCFGVDFEKALNELTQLEDMGLDILKDHSGNLELKNKINELEYHFCTSEERRYYYESLYECYYGLYYLYAIKGDRRMSHTYKRLKNKMQKKVEKELKG